MDIVVKGRNVEVPDHYRVHVSEKLHKIERYDQKIIRVDVELFHERNPRQTDRCQRVEITCASRGPVVRAEACAGDFYSALDLAITKLDGRLRRMADRRRIHRGRRAPVSVAAATSGLAVVSRPDAFAPPIAESLPDGTARTRLLPVHGQGVGAAQRGVPPPRVRLRSHFARAMTGASLRISAMIPRCLRR